MRKILFVLLLVCAASTALADPPDEDVHRPHIAGKGHYYLQFDLGLNLTFLDGNSVARFPDAGEGETDFFQSGSGIAPLFGITLGREFSQHFALSLRADYDSRHVAMSRTVQDTCPLFDPIGNQVDATIINVSKDFAVTADYLSLSLLGNVRFDKLYLFFGPTVSLPLGFEARETDQILDTMAQCTYFYGRSDSSKTISGAYTANDVTTTRVSFKLGVGYLIPLTPKISLVPQLAYDLHLNNTLDNDVPILRMSDGGTSTAPVVVNSKMRLNALQATIGLRINL
jgi:hypothetical protein